MCWPGRNVLSLSDVAGLSSWMEDASLVTTTEPAMIGSPASRCSLTQASRLLALCCVSNASAPHGLPLFTQLTMVCGSPEKSSTIFHGVVVIGTSESTVPLPPQID